MPARLFLMGIAFPCLLLVSGQTSRGQSVSGQIVDASDLKGLPGANVFIAGTTLGAASREDGSFRIGELEAGVHRLVVSIIGYEPEVRRIRVEAFPLDIGRIKLTPLVYDAEDVVVSSERPRNWDRNLKRFTREFLGTSQNARRCTIVDPYVLDFEEDPVTSILRASASAPIIVENRALGYRVTFVLEDFELSLWDYRIRFRGQPRFEPLEPTDSEELSRWQEARTHAYAGSLQHFLAALARDRTSQEGFELRTGDADVVDPTQVRFLPVTVPDSLIIDGAVPYEKILFSERSVHVTYVREDEPGAYARFVTEVTGVPQRPGPTQHSVLTFARAVTIHTSGYLYDPYGVETTGYWIWERVADWLPRDYVGRNSPTP